MHRLSRTRQGLSRFILFALASFLCTALTACSGQSVVGGAPQRTLSALALAPATLELPITESQRLTASALYSDGTSAALSAGLSWSSSAPAVATVDATGLVTAQGSGAAIISVSALGLVAGSTVVTTPAPPRTLTAITLSPPGPLALAVGATAQLQATGTYSDQTTAPLGSAVSWQSSAAAIASVSSGGLVTALSPGSCTITAADGALQASAAINIPQPTPTTTPGQVFFDGVYAAGVTFHPATGATTTVAIDPATLNPAGHASLVFSYPATGFTGGAFLSSTPLNLSSFDSLTFWAKASAPMSLGKFGIGDNAGLTPNTADAEVDGLAISTQWTLFVIPLPNPALYTQASGLGTLYDSTNQAPLKLWLSDIQYVQSGSAALGAPALQFTAAGYTVQINQTTQLVKSDLSLTWSLSGAPLTLSNPNLDFFSFSSDAPAVATVSSAGLVTAVASGTANLHASLGSVQSSNALPITVDAPGYDPGAGWTLVWSDEFNGTALDTTVWNYDLGAGGWGNSESECYQQQNATVAGGYLTITAKEETGCVGTANGSAPYTSARIQTAQKKQFTYGKFSMRAKLPYSQGMWPAFWMLGADSNSQGGIYGGNTSWPTCGEIDIMEMIGGLADGSGDYTTHGTLHYMDAEGRDPGPSYAYRYTDKLAADFHVYEIVWTPTSFTWLFDGVAFGSKIMSSDMTALNQPMFILLNLAIGGPWGGWTDASTVFPQTYVIDYVRQYTNPSITQTGAEGLASTWHLLSCTSSICSNGSVTGVTPAGQDLESTPGTISGFQPTKMLTAAANWYSAPLTGVYDSGAWQLGLFTTSPGSASVVRADLFVVAADGTSPTQLGSAQLDTNATGGGNHLSYFSFPGVPSVTLANQRLKVVLTPVSGAAPEMIYNGNDFDTALTAPWSPASGG